jgi:hypothetical protein
VDQELADLAAVVVGTISRVDPEGNVINKEFSRRAIKI